MVRRVRLLLIWLVIGMLSLELFLQGGALIVKATGRDAISSWTTGNTRILALGDSNTYGLFLPPEQSYPAQLEALWNKNFESPKIEVINLGYPGTNSSVLLMNLPKLLDTFKPDIVTVMVGANDFWTDVANKVKPDDTVIDQMAVWLRQNSKVYKLLYMVERSFYDPSKLDLGDRIPYKPETIDAEKSNVIHKDFSKAIREGKFTKLSEVQYGNEKFELGFTSGKSVKGDVKNLQKNLEAILNEIDQKSIQAVFLTYPSGREYYGIANQITRATAQSTGTPLIDIANALKKHCPNPKDCPGLFFPDNHAKSKGYGIAANQLVIDFKKHSILVSN